MHAAATRRLPLRCAQWRPITRHIREKSTLHTELVETDACGIPVRPTWSVDELLSSYPKPTIPPSTLKRLHELAALVPPVEGTPEHTKLTREMEGLVRLVEAVKLVDTRTGIELDESIQPNEGSQDHKDQKLFSHSSRVRRELYIVDADKVR
ncbi:hypothetical protein IEO21_04544 [Rhodonia placenta]|uniref:Glutamyl-tRNA(Gln) amidotransferase subunit F, mitochondrial n=1 Tax=Rhodonia placenta TaxID=104341 RepID=A0A8H7U2G2_9APHY|nr:hypothetical protein IEO21_04544 [Postia placenta]